MTARIYSGSDLFIDKEDGEQYLHVEFYINVEDFVKEEDEKSKYWVIDRLIDELNDMDNVKDSGKKKVSTSLYYEEGKAKDGTAT